MSRHGQSSSAPSEILVSAEGFFRQMVQEGLENRRVETIPLVEQYLVELLEFYVLTENLYEEYDEGGRRKTQTLAELFLKAQQESPAIRQDMLKKLGDMSLYVSGFFGDSLKRKLVDIDYYADIGGTAYGSLASLSQRDIFSRVYREFSERFMDFVDVLTYISQQAMVQTNKDLLRLYDRYVSTGSELAKEQLIEKGILTPPVRSKTRQ